jgi:inorganic pyrophosphatase
VVDSLHCLVEIPKGSRNKYEWDDKGQDDKIPAVPHEDPNWSGPRELSDLPDQLRVEIEHVFSIDKQPEGKEVVADGWYERDAPIEESQVRWGEGRS